MHIDLAHVTSHIAITHMLATDTALIVLLASNSCESSSMDWVARITWTVCHQACCQYSATARKILRQCSCLGEYRFKILITVASVIARATSYTRGVIECPLVYCNEDADSSCSSSTSAMRSILWLKFVGAYSFSTNTLDRQLDRYPISLRPCLCGIAMACIFITHPTSHMLNMHFTSYPLCIHHQSYLTTPETWKLLCFKYEIVTHNATLKFVSLYIAKCVQQLAFPQRCEWL